jgi:hypothetical protein
LSIARTLNHKAASGLRLSLQLEVCGFTLGAGRGVLLLPPASGVERGASSVLLDVTGREACGTAGY